MSLKTSLKSLLSRTNYLMNVRGARRQKGQTARTEQLETRALLAVFSVTSTADSNAAGTLRNAINQANSTPGADEINFAEGTNGTEIDLTLNQFQITESLTITGNGAGNTVIDAQLGSRILEITGSSVNVTISGVTLKNGLVAGAGLQVGGAILFNATGTGTLSIFSSVLSGNTVNDTNADGAYGGAVFMQHGNLSITGSSITGNSADWGGAIYATGDSDITITDSYLNSNQASNDGGAVYAGFGGQGDVTITSSQVEGNSSQKRGGAIKADNVTITGSTVRLNNATTEGGAIRADGNVQVSNSDVSDNTSSAAGGAIKADGDVTISNNSTIRGNAAVGNGGAIISVGSTQVTKSTISGNSTSGARGKGGAICSNSGAVTISQSTLSGNSTAGSYSYGGAIYAYSGAVTISQSTLSGNSTTGYAADGGAIYAKSGAITISQSTLSGNSTAQGNADGGAIYANSGAVTIGQSTLSGNFTNGPSGDGGALLTRSGSVTISQSTLTLNSAPQAVGGAIFSHSAPMTILNSILAGNTDDDVAPDVRPGAAFTVTNSLIGRNNRTGLAATGSTPDLNGNLVGGDSAGAAINPLLGPLASNGGPTQTHALLATSPAINRGSNALAVDVTQAGNPALTSDQRGNPFVRIFDTTVDMGATERFAGALVVSTHADEVDGNISSGDLSLREAILLANGNVGANTITFAPALFTSGPASIVLTMGELTISESATISGPGQTQLSIDANQSSRVLNVIGGTQINVTLAGLTLTGGRTTASNANFSDTTHSGGGIRFDSTGTLTLANSTVSGNSTTGNLAPGGGIFASQSGQVILTNSTVSGNSTTGNSSYGGGISSFNGNVTLTNSTVSGNSTTGGSSSGGGIDTVAGTVTLTNSTVSGNRTTGANSPGGGIGMRVTSVILTDSTVSGNSTAGIKANGGGISTNSGGVMLTRSTISGNSTAGSGANGGGIFTNSGEVRLTNTTLSGNKVTGTDSDGGGIRFDNSVVTIVNSTVTGNSATRAGGGLGMVVGPQDMKLTIHNSIIAGNTAASHPDFTAPTNPTTNLEVRHSLIGRSDGTTLTASANPDTNGNLIGGTTDPAKTDPLLAPLADNGGPTLTHALLINSPAINRGNNALAVDVTQSGNPALTTDQRGNSFARIVGPTVDMGSFEIPLLNGTTGADAFVLTYSATTTAGTTTVTISTGGGPVVNLGTFPMNAPLTINGLGGTDSVRIVGTSGVDTFSMTDMGKFVNGASLNLMNIENRTLAGAAGGDIYKFDADIAQGLWTLDDAAGETDTIDLSSTNPGVNLNLSLATSQVVNANLSLILGSATAFENAIGGAGPDTLIGNSLNNVLIGGSGGDTFNGGAGNDDMFGGIGSDIYRFSAAVGSEADIVRELASQGDDRLDFTALSSGVTFSLNTNSIQAVHTGRTLQLNSATTFENIFGSSGPDVLTGNALANTLSGEAGNDTLNGLGGNDNLFGGLDNDAYIFATPTTAEADLVSEYVNQGTDTIAFDSLTTSVTLSLNSNIVQQVHTNRTLRLNSATTFENARGGVAADTLTGNAANNVILGLNGGDTLIGGPGNDDLQGGLGDDIYRFGPSAGAEADVIRELASQGTDRIDFTAVSTGITLSLNTNSVQAVHTGRTLQLNSNATFENIFGSSGPDVLTGNALANTLSGEAGNDTLNGLGGNDNLFGGLNDDTYVFSAAASAEADTVNEYASQGTDVLSFASISTSLILNLNSISVQNVHASRTLKLNSGVTFENIVAGNGNDTLIGNSLSNHLLGGNGNNILVGLNGSDILESGAGRDILVGGPGLDRLSGGTGDDILIAGRTIHDLNIANLDRLRTEWISSGSYATRIANLRAGTGSPAVALKATIDVLNDPGDDDVLTGGGAADWFFRALDDVITDLFAGEVIDEL